MIKIRGIYEYDTSLLFNMKDKTIAEYLLEQVVIDGVDVRFEPKDLGKFEDIKKPIE